MAVMLAAAMAFGVPVAVAQNTKVAKAESTTTTYNFEDDAKAFTDDSRVTSAIENDETLDSNVLTFTCANNAGNGYSFAHYDFSSLVDGAKRTTISFDYYNTFSAKSEEAGTENDGRGILSLGSATIRGNSGNSSQVTESNPVGYDSSGVAFNIGSDKKYAVLNGSGDSTVNKYSTSVLCNKWLHVQVGIDEINNTYNYTITQKSDNTVLYSENNLSYLDSEVENITQIDIYGYLNNSKMIMLDNLTIEKDGNPTLAGVSVSSTFLKEGTEVLDASGNFDLTMNFKNASKGSDTFKNYCVDLYDLSNHHVWLRADNYVMSTAGAGDSVLEFGHALPNDWQSKMQAGADCTVTIVRKDNYLKCTMNSAGDTMSGIVDVSNLDSNVKFRISGEYVNIYDVSYSLTENSDDTALQYSRTFSGVSWGGLANRVIKNDFDVTYTFKMTATGSDCFDVFHAEVKNSTGGDYVTMRADNATGFYWTADGYTGSVSQETVWSEAYEGYSATTNEKFISLIRSGLDCSVNFKREGDKTTVTFTMGDAYTSTFTINYAYGTSEMIDIGGEACTISNLSFSDNSAQKNRYSLSGYRTGTFTSPKTVDKVFAGWFTDSTCTEAISKETTTGLAYAKFVDKTLLTAKAQSCKVESDTNSLYNEGVTFNADTYKLRLLTAVDGKDYDKVGFKVTYTKGETEVEKDLNSTTVYSNVDAEGIKYSAATIFGKSAAYIMPALIYNIGSTYIESESSAVSFNVTPYWVTLDGTTVTGASRDITGKQIQENAAVEKF